MLLRGVFLLMGAEFCFALATVFARLVTDTSAIPAVEITFARFFLGMFLGLFYLARSGVPFRPNRWDLVFWRGVTNTMAVVFLFMAIPHTTITNANMLNKIYPALLFLVAPLITHERRMPPILFVFLLLTMTGVTLVIHPDFHQVRIGDFYGLMSGIVSAFAVATLRKACAYDSPPVILFHLMWIGAALNLLMMIPVFTMPHGMTWVYLLASALMGVLGQGFITSGYKHISARAGGMVSSSNILFAAALGMIFFNEVLTLRILIGGLCIVVSIIGVALAMRERVPDGE